MKKGETWFGRPDTPYEGVEASLQMITVRNMQVSFSRAVQLKGMRLLGEVMSKGKFRRTFDRVQQLNLFK